ncbi:hypothetical protein [Glycomyces harbinensis]|uniref:hypothetical protein n=1 Tax=Glycomyces harbinensis TaxID=58114 RepID=UPI00115F78DD|nr:hypothetical protein [Glycomyces harbinensis]
MSRPQETVPVDSPVPLSPIVVDTLEALLPGDNPVHCALRRQIPFTTMEEGCPCGCTSVDLWVDKTKCDPAPAHEGRPLADGNYVDTDVYAGVILFTSDGYLRSLEIHSWLEEPIRRWPDLSHLDVAPSHYQ